LDNLTHSLVGLFLARAGFRRFSPGATAITVIAANIPDFDVVSWFAGRPEWLHWHRNITHSIVAMPVMAILSVVLVRFAGRKPVRWLPAFVMALAAVVSHLALDMTNIYAVRLFLPFSGQWLSWDLTPVVDLTIWAILLLGVAIPLLGRLVGSEIGEKRRAYPGTGAAIFSLLLLAAYDGSRAYFHNQALQALSAQPVTDQKPLRISAFPTLNPIRWIGLEELSDSWAEIPVDLREGRLDLSELQTIHKAEPVPAMAAARQEHDFQILSAFIQYPLWTVQPAPDDIASTEVTLLDLRFGQPLAPGFASATAIVDPRNQVKSTSFGGPLPSVRPR
jgi:inner membrane protein